MCSYANFLLSFYNTCLLVIFSLISVTECNVEQRACSTPETEYPSPTPAGHRLIFRPFPVAVDTYRSIPYTVPTRSYVGQHKDSARQYPVQTSTFYAVQNCRNVDDNDVYDSNRSSPEPERNVCTNDQSDISLDSLGESCHQSPSPFKSKKKKKLRTVFSRSQIYQLEAAFDMKRYLTDAERAGLAASLKLSETQIKIWFQNRRNKWKRQINGEMDEIPISPAFASRFLQNGLYPMNSARADLVLTGPSLPAHVNVSPYQRESLQFPYRT
ncbi:hypothetical protein DPMN_166238 [Dreissena polymorpha]|uniref:Homeobox domain-containing protein n=1 Tax=Dreissena polymorpha TaxID=45954 RepID=A0A9D4IXE5_DREPO|nr:hypothetical protein DPMN_166238 [Dreissena polymorpha]